MASTLSAVSARARCRPFPAHRGGPPALGCGGRRAHGPWLERWASPLRFCGHAPGWRCAPVQHLVKFPDPGEVRMLTMLSSDQDLLTRFAASADEAAFTALVERHAALVLSACRRVLDDHHDAEDASQAVFLILAKKAGSIAAQPTLAPWLYRVAIDTARTARTSRQARTAREQREREVQSMSRSARPTDSAGDLDDALSQLPERERSAIVLFHLEGRPLVEVAQLVQRPTGT